MFLSFPPQQSVFCILWPASVSQVARASLRVACKGLKTKPTLTASLPYDFAVVLLVGLPASSPVARPLPSLPGGGTMAQVTRKAPPRRGLCRSACAGRLSLPVSPLLRSKRGIRSATPTTPSAPPCRPHRPLKTVCPPLQDPPGPAHFSSSP